MLLSARSGPLADLPPLDPCLTRAAPYSKLTPPNPPAHCHLGRLETPVRYSKSQVQQTHPKSPLGAS